MSDNKAKSLIVIGGGPGGYVAAIRAAQLGADVTLIEKEHLGGTCLNVGCIPTKALLHVAETAAAVRNGAAIGVHAELESICWPEVMAYKDKTVKTLTGGVASLLRSAGVRVVNGTAAFLKPKTVEVTAADGTKTVMEADRFIIASGSVPVMPPIPGLRESKYVLDSTGILSLEALPQSLLIIGGGVIGIEIACALSALGCRVTIVEALDRLAPNLDGEIAAQLLKALSAQGIGIYLQHKVTSVADGETEATVTAEEGGREKTFTAEKVLCCVGRRPYTEGLAPEAGGLRTERGKLLVDEYLETAVPGVYAIGDCIGQVMLAHTASAQGEAAAENAMGARRKNYRPEEVPSCVYSFPETAGVGFTEEQLKAAGKAYHAARFPLSANGRALIVSGGEGLVKVLVGDELDEVLGVHIIGPHATEMIGEAAIALRLEATAEEVIDTIHAHPTVTEAVREAFLAADGRAIHMPNKKKKG